MQVIHNILDNASEYVKLDSKILLLIKKNKYFCIMHFADQGSAIHLDYKDKIFQRFYTDIQ